uniref:AB hydrolase-1 domain-containing protein n=1 Tax=Oryza punctata TaxID=4537 RepID=A0A0E0K1R1_ORYPU
MASIPLLRLLLLLLPLPLREHLWSSHRPKDVAGVSVGVGAGAGELHPIFVVPGASCSNLEARLTEAYRPSVPSCGALKGKGWFGLWDNSSDLSTYHYNECFEEQMSLVYDPVSNDYRNFPGVETRVAKFGLARGLHSKNPSHPDWCLEKLIGALEEMGYHDGDNMHGVPYDVRYAAPIPGQVSQVYSRHFKEFMELVETASKKHHKKAIILGHSLGGMVALEFVRNTPLAWRNRYIEHLFLISPTISPGFVVSVRNLVSGPQDILYVPDATALSLRPMWRSFEISIDNFPSPEVFGHEPIVITKQRNYSAYDFEDLLAAIGFSDGFEPFRRRMAARMNYFEAPMVSLTCINGVGNRTPRQLVYWDGNFDEPAQTVFDDGDDTINLISMLAFDEEMRRQPGQKGRFKSIKLDKASHGSVLTDEWALRRVMQEILEVNRNSS